MSVILRKKHYIFEGKKRKYLFGVAIFDEHYKNIKYEIKEIYSRWKSMLFRCYGEDTKYCYQDCTVCEEWLTFSNFKRWMEQQDYEGKELDKDLRILGNTEYSEAACMFIPPWLNKFTIKKDKAQGPYPLGVYAVKSPKTGEVISYISSVSSRNSRVKSKRTKDALEAHKCWQLAKANLALKYSEDFMDDPLIYTALTRIRDKLMHDYNNNLETKDY